MNKSRRVLLQKATCLLETAKSYVSDATDQEQDCFYNIPENLEGSDMYDKMENAIDSLNSAMESIDDAISYIDEASE